MKWSSKNPIKAGLLAFIPTLATVGIVKAAKGIGKLVGGGAEGLGRVAGVKTAGKQPKKEWGYGLDEFVGFAGAKTEHPIGGVLKTLQMLVYVIFTFFPGPTSNSCENEREWIEYEDIF